MQDHPNVLPAQKSNDELIRLLESHPLPTGTDDGKPFSFSYGTAGFRYDNRLLDGVMVRVGILAALRALALQQDVGVMVTASHNDESYNGVKLADPHGGMMAPEGEALAVELANAASVEDVMHLVHKHSGVAPPPPPRDGSSFTKAAAAVRVCVHFGRDTRSHSPALLRLAQRAAQAMGAVVVSHGVVTTPQLHHMVRHANPHHLSLWIPPRPNLQGYYDLMAHAYHNLLLTTTTTTTTKEEDSTAETLAPLVVDCACGVGYPAVQRLHEALQRLSATTCCRPLVPRNAPGEGPLNENCGSEHVQKQVQPPKWYDINSHSSISGTDSMNYVCSLDGDADRIVFFRQQSPSCFTLWDGDKMAALICGFLQTQLQLLKEALQSRGASLQPPLKLGVVQTAYANGASTAYLQRVLGEDCVLVAKTGVKHVHHTAEAHLDIGVYFEANGHGTVLFGNAFDRAMANAYPIVGGECVALRRLCLLPSLVNQAVGDSLSDMLLVDAILQLQGWTMDTWDGLYQDLPSRQCKVKVQDRSVIKTNENETRCTSPIELQRALDEAMQSTSGGRTFVRPSGTENVVRVYAEAATPQEADALATRAAKLVHDMCGGEGEPPCFPSSKM